MPRLPHHATTFAALTRAGLLCALALCLPPARRARAAGPLLEGEIRALAISGDRVAALRGGEVVVLDTAGRRLGVLDRDRISAAAAVAAAARAAPAPPKKRRAIADDVLDLAGLPDDDLESELAEATLDDEGIATGHRRHRADAAGADDDDRSPVPDDQARGPADGRTGAARLLAASDREIWIGGADGLSRLATDRDRDAPALLAHAVPVGPRRLSLSAIAVAPDGAALAGLGGDHLIRSSDRGASWTLLAVLAVRPRAVEISADGGDVYLLDDDGVALVAHRQRVPIFEGRAYHIARCAEDLLILAEDGLYAWRADRGVERRSGRLPVRRLVCAPAAAGGIVLGLGADLVMSRDGGRTWTARDDLPSLEIESLALTSDTLWIGTTSGLVTAPLAPPDAPPTDTRPSSRLPGAEGEGAAPPSFLTPPSFLSPPSLAGRSTPWLGLLPRVSLAVSASSTRPGGDRGVVWLLLSFPLGRARGQGRDSARVAAELLRRRGLAAAELARNAGRAAQNDEDGESAARARMLREILERP